MCFFISWSQKLMKSIYTYSFLKSGIHVLQDHDWINFFSGTACHQIRANETQVRLLPRLTEKRLLLFFRALSHSRIIRSSYRGNSSSTGCSSLIYSSVGQPNGFNMKIISWISIHFVPTSGQLCGRYKTRERYSPFCPMIWKSNFWNRIKTHEMGYDSLCRTEMQLHTC